jgi:hypothetical protein
MSKVTSVESLERETHWIGAKEHGPSLLEVICAHTPIPPVPLTAASVSLPSQQIPSVLLMLRKQQCGKCKQEGHIGMLCSYFIPCGDLSNVSINLLSFQPSLPCQYRSCGSAERATSCSCVRREYPRFGNHRDLYGSPPMWIWIKHTPQCTALRATALLSPSSHSA